MMKVIHKRDIIRDIPRNWMRTYAKHEGDCTWNRDKTFEMIRTELQSLDVETCSPADIDRVIGTSGWADNKCDECGLDSPVVVQIGDEPDYEARWVDLCPACLAKAAAHGQPEPKDGT